MRTILLAFISLAISPTLVAQQGLNNDLVMKLVKAGLSEDLIGSMINVSPGAYDASPEGLMGLKSAGATDKEIVAIIQRTAIAMPRREHTIPQKQDLPTPVSLPSASFVSTHSTDRIYRDVDFSRRHATSSQNEPDVPGHRSTDGKLRIFVTDAPLFQSTLSATGEAAAHSKPSGPAPTIVEAQADFLKVCPEYIVASRDQDRADYVLVLARKGNSTFALRNMAALEFWEGTRLDNVSLLKNNGDIVFTTGQNRVEAAIKEVCARIPPPM